MKLYPYYNLPISIDEAYYFFDSVCIQQFIVELYNIKPADALDTIALCITHEYNGYSIILLIDYNDPELYCIRIDNIKINRSIKIKKDMESIYKAICDIKNGTLPLIENETINTNHIKVNLYDYIII